MKKIVLAVILVAAGVLVYNHLSADRSPVEREIADLEQRFEAARENMAGAGRAAGLAGVDTTADAAAARAEIDALLRDLGRLKDQAQGAEVAEIERVERTVREYRKTIG